jgi:hypothetical protein
MRKLVVLSLVVLTACSVQKRRYQKGLYVDWHSSSRQESAQNSHHIRDSRPVKSTVTVKAYHPSARVDDQLDETSVASAGKSLSLPPSVLKRKFRKSDPDSCDRIIMRNGEERDGRIIEITPTLVRYRKCTAESDVVYAIARSEVSRIKYASGIDEVLSAAPSPAPSNNTYNAPREHPDAITVYILTALGWFIGIGSIPAIVIGSRILREMRENPGKYSDEGTIKACVVASWVKVVLVLLFFLLIIAIALSF